MSSCIRSKKSANWVGALFFVVCMVCGRISVAAEQAGTIEVGMAALRFNYSEFSDAGSHLDTEMGGILGGTLKASVKRHHWEIETKWSYHQGQVAYTGQSNFGTPYNTHTDEKIGDMAMRVGGWLDTRYPVMPFVGIGYRRWDRDILPATLGGLFESYQWKYAWLGTKVALPPSGTAQHMLDVGVLKPVHPEMSIDFKGAYNASPRVYPESQLGIRVLITSNMRLTRAVYFVVEPYYEYWKLGRSSVVTQNGVSVYEPKSETKNVGFNVCIGKNF